MEEINEVSDRAESEIKINRLLVFSFIALALLMNTIDSTIVATALHTLQHELGTSVSWSAWTMTAYSLGFVLMLPLSAKLSIFYGHRRIFMTSVFVFTISSLLCGLSTNIYMLIAMRVVQAIGGAGITPSATGIIVDHFGNARPQYLGLFGSIFSTGAMIGPIFGGLFVTYLNWQWIFFINIPIGVLVLFFAYRFIPKDLQKDKTRHKMDFPGLIMLGIAVLSAMYGATYYSQNPDNHFSPLFISLIVISIFFFTFLMRHLRRTENPFIQARFIEGKGFGAVNLLNFVHAGMVIGCNSLIPLYAVSRYGISDLHSGTLLVTNGIASVVLSTVMSIRIRQTGYRLPLYIGSVILSFGVAMLFFAPPFNLTPYIWLMISTFFIGTGFGVMSPASRNAGIQLVPEQSANIAAVRSLGLQMGQITAITIATAVITSSVNSTHAHSIIYLVLAFILISSLPIISKVPESKGAW